MAKLIAVCRDKVFPFERRQIPLMIEETLTVGRDAEYLCCIFCANGCSWTVQPLQGNRFKENWKSD